jgi:hypothetical protein
MFAKHTIGAVAIAVAFGISGSSAYAATLLYDNTTGGTGTYPGALVETFTVNQTGVAVTSLAAYDSAAFNSSGPTGITTNIYVGLYNDTTGSAAIAAVNFNGTAYNGTGGSYFVTKSLSTSYSLVSGDTYSIEAWGFNSTNGDYYKSGGAVSFNPSIYLLTNVPGNSAASGQTATNIDGTTTGGLMNALYGNTDAYTGPNPCMTGPPSVTCTTDGPVLRFNSTDAFAAGSLVVSQINTDLTTPLPAALPLFASGLGALGLLGWRRKRKAAAIAA